MNVIRTTNRKKHVKSNRDTNKSPQIKRRLSKGNLIVSADESVNTKLSLILRFKVEEYSAKVHCPEKMSLYWHSHIYRNPIQLAKSHFQEIMKLARFDQNHVTRHINYLTQVTLHLSFVMDSTGIEFEGLTKEQVEDCASNKDFEFEIIEITC